ncbi:phospholipase D-like domain-containing protein [Sphingomonas sp. PP-CE-1G-424]|uniref:phospholipase D-like domain-containing protein n=1 Tax=Sphingomonas sp. PP-CE-1G-424 TaxID=2135658 RepID=UPI0010567F31|nr:phospholipase D-like domain-containing protein [Sphingomonas sp. PP-CE-1G-424]TCP66734.1 phosphatidylserine/phosphatidylglycerophosphate/cardiolipin synthase-like enzyme [Sphingomonas sp. PP-CE-1G-424]
MQVGTECWRVERAEQMAVIVDAADYFRTARVAMMGAKRRILLIGWDFDARIALEPGVDRPGEPKTLGEFMLWLVDREPDLEIFVLRWDTGAIKSLFRGSTVFTMMKWMKHKRIHTKLDGHHPTAASHHQKIVIIDDALAFCGGIDMTGDRWDTRDHRDGDPHRVQPSGKPYKPWHDAISAVQGPVAHALGELFRRRWHLAGGMKMAAGQPGGKHWPEGLPVDFRDVDVAIARSEPEMSDQEPVYESEALFLGQIARAKKHLYIESQYFASRKIAEAVARRLDEADGPEIVIINPTTAQGWLEPIAMDTARARLMEALHRRDTHGRLRMYHPYTAGGEPIYCHAKILIADDDVFRLGSSNMNNRSLRLDTECDLAIRATDDATARGIAAIRDGLIAEHLGVEVSVVSDLIAETGSLIETIERLRGKGKTVQPYEVPDLTAVEEWLADNEVLDPEGPEEMFEALSKRGLFRRLRRKK